jgi:hypothetical protein
MSIEAMKQALDFLEWFAGDDHSIRPKHKAPEIAAALRQAIEQAEKQEPVGYVSESGKGAYLLVGVCLEDDTPLYTAPLKREWVGLTDEDIYKVIEENIPPQLNTLFDMAKWVGGVIEAKLKEKNT